MGMRGWWGWARCHGFKDVKVRVLLFGPGLILEGSY